MARRPSVLVALSAVPAKSALRIARALVAERRCACVNVVRGATSVYRWQGVVRTDSESLLVMKLTARAWPALRARLLELHPYELPEVVALPLAAGHAPYLEWVARETA